MYACIYIYVRVHVHQGAHSTGVPHTSGQVRL